MGAGIDGMGVSRSDGGKGYMHWRWKEYVVCTASLATVILIESLIPTS